MNYPIPFGKYLLLDRVNVGGMAEVFKAKALGVEGFERILAIKRILPNMADDDEFINMFVDEARIAVQLSHANIVQIYELGKYEGQYYIAMEYVPGRDLRHFLDQYRKQKKMLPLPAAAYIVSKVCDGLDYAHRKTDPSGKPMNVIHRDVSPQNILTSFEGSVKVTDFGIAKAEDRASKTQAGVLKGKFGYMSPEQVRGLDIDQRSDIFAVGILFYEMVTGKRLFVGESDFSTLEKVRNADVTSPREHNPDISEALEQVVLKALAKDRDQRYQWCSEFAEDLQQFLISDNKIFGPKNMATLLGEEYAADIEAEKAKMEEYVKMQPPANLQDEMRHAAEEQKAHSKKSSTASTGNSGGWGNEAKGEKTMIFDSNLSDLGNAATHVGEAVSMGKDSTASGSVSKSSPKADRGSATGVSRVSVVRSTRAGTGTAPKQKSGGKNLGAIIVGAAALVSLLVVLVVLLASGGGTGTVVITSTPTDMVDVFLDGTLIGSKTPITRGDIEEGEHTVLARAAGYKDRAYRFELVAGSPALITVQLERDAGAPAVGTLAPPTAPVPGMVDLKVTTDPIGVSVRLAGLPRGVTPLTLPGLDPAQPLILELSKEGYRADSITVQLKPGVPLQELTHALKPLAPGAVVPASPGTPSAPATMGTIDVRSNPSGATVYVGRNKVGVTPISIPDRNTATSHDIEVAKSGFKAVRQTVSFNGQTALTLNYELETEERKPAPRPGPGPGREREEGGGGGGGGGGSCSGSAARISVMAVGAQECTIQVGKEKLGVAPVFKKEAPTGRCEVKVTCRDGKSFKKVVNLKSGSEEKLIIKATDWSG